MAKIAKKLIDEIHTDLDGERIDYVYRDKVSRSGGKEVWGKARIITGLNAYLARAGESDDPFFLIEIAEPIWLVLDDKARIALVDHELCHCSIDYDEDGLKVLSMVGHDLEEFHGIIRRHGMWRPSIQAFNEQLRFWDQVSHGRR